MSTCGYDLLRTLSFFCNKYTKMWQEFSEIWNINIHQKSNKYLHKHQCSIICRRIPLQNHTRESTLLYHTKHKTLFRSFPPFPLSKWIQNSHMAKQLNLMVNSSSCAPGYLHTLQYLSNRPTLPQQQKQFDNHTHKTHTHAPIQTS